MLINDEWRKYNPINDILEPRENLLWIGRPNEAIYVRGNRTRWGIINVCTWSSVIFLVSVIGIIFSNGGIQTLTCVTMLIVLPIVDFMVLAPNDYKLADWYAFSEKRIFLASWNHDDYEFTIYPTELSNLKDVFVTKVKDAPKDAGGMGTLICIFHREIPKRLSRKFVLDLIDNPAEVQALLVDAKAATIV